MRLREFAPSPERDEQGPNEEEILHRLASQWWNGDEDPRAERALAAMGWEIGQDEGYDNGGAFVIRFGDINGNSFISWPAEELTLNEFAPSPGYGDDDWDSDVPRYLHHFANIWWNAADPKIQKYIEDQMATGGWTIRQIGEEMVELRHREGTRYRISSDEFDPDLR